MPLLPLLFAAAVSPDFLVHGGASMTGTFATAGGFWFGGNASIAVRYRETTEARVDGGVGFLLPKPSTPDTCGEPPCFEGGRVLLVPTIGPRLVVGGTRVEPVAVTPFVGWAFVAQIVYPGPRTPAFDAEIPRGWMTLAAGVGLTYANAELRLKLLAPRGEVDQTTIEIGFGILF